MDIRPFHTARRCNSQLLPTGNDQLSLTLSFRIELIRVEPTTSFNFGGGIHATGNGILHDNVDGSHQTFQLDPWTDAEWADFRANFSRVILNYWDGKFRLVPTEPWYGHGSSRREANIDCRLAIHLVDADSGVHQRYFIIKPRQTTFRSFAQAHLRRALLTHRDLWLRSSTRRVRVGSEWHRVDFWQCTALHEFGHTLELDHIAGQGNHDAAYGTTLEARSNIMGTGHQLSTRQARPWIRRLERHLIRRPGRADFDARFSARMVGLQLIAYWDWDEVSGSAASAVTTAPPPSQAPAPPPSRVLSIRTRW